MAARILERLRFSRADGDATISAVANHMAFKDVKEMRVAKLKRFMAREGFADELELHRVDCTSSNGILENHAFLLAKGAEFAAAPLIPPPLITGHDLKMLGLAPGPHFKQILDAVSERQLEGTLTTREAALDWVRSAQ
jgi:poly(A) polymerase